MDPVLLTGRPTMTVPSSLSCRDTGEELGCTAGTWFIHDYDSILRLHVRHVCLRGQKIAHTPILDLYISEGIWLVFLPLIYVTT